MAVMIATSAGKSGAANEDFAAVTAKAAVLLDGAGLSGTRSKCIHGVAWFTRRLGGNLLANLADEATSLPSVLATSITETADTHRDSCDLQDPGTPCATVVMVRVAGDQLQYLVLADSLLVIEPITDEPIVITDRREATIGRSYRAAMDAAHNDTDQHHEARRVYVETLRAHRNQPGGFWMAAAEPAAASEAVVGTRPLAQTTSVALLSDGAGRLTDRFGLMSWRQTLDVLRGGGPDEVIRQVRRAEASDPHGHRWPRGKTHDDATAIIWTDLVQACET